MSLPSVMKHLKITGLLTNKLDIINFYKFSKTSSSVKTATSYENHRLGKEAVKRLFVRIIFHTDKRISSYLNNKQMYTVPLSQRNPDYKKQSLILFKN